MKISLSLPFKPDRIGGRMDHLSWIDKADDPDGIELIYAVDEPYTPPQCAQVIICEEYGSLNLHKYHNDIANATESDYIQIMSDDCECLTKGWDSILLAEDFMVTQIGHSVAYPCISRKWVDLFGYAALHTIDAWIYFVSRGFERKCPEIKWKQHTDDDSDPDRKLINNHISYEFHSKRIQDLINLDREKLSAYLSEST